jgi:hypothetical protein
MPGAARRWGRTPSGHCREHDLDRIPPHDDEARRIAPEPLELEPEPITIPAGRSVHVTDEEHRHGRREHEILSDWWGQITPHHRRSSARRLSIRPAAFLCEV